MIAKFKRLFNRIYKPVAKGINILWKRHHFIIPPTLLKRYITSFYKNIVNPKFDSYYDINIQKEYLAWLDENKEEIKIEKLKYNPLVSILVPVYNIDGNLLSECIESVLNQTYTNWELCLADDCSTKAETKETLEKYSNLDERIKVVYRKKNGNISEATNSALEISNGEFIALLDNDDLLAKNALYEMVKALNEDKEIDMIYSDEDKLELNGKRCDPHFKPDWSPDMLLSSNYICHFTMIRKELVNKVGGFRTEFNGAQDYDMFLRITELTNKIHHIPKILYHWRKIPGSTSMDMDNKGYAFDAGKRALLNALKRRKIDGIVNEVEGTNYYCVDYKIKKEPKISIIIPTRNYYDDLKKCIDSIYEKTNYKNYEIIVVDNGSDEEETLSYLKECEKKYKNFKVLRIDEEFNYSRLNNAAAKISTGEYLVLLNNDTEVITNDWLRIMVGYAMQEHAGCVGAKLLYFDNTVQHCGVVVNPDEIATHISTGAYDDNPGIYGRLYATSNYMAVTAACLMIKKEKFDLVGGLEEDLKVAYNDVDLNFKMLENGYFNVVLPQVKLYHYESKSRGLDNTVKKYERFVREINYMMKKWGNYINNDKYYNKNFSMEKWYSLNRKTIVNKNEAN